MQFRILGPLEVSTDEGRTLDLPAKQRVLLAILLLHANETVSTDRLIDELWGSEPPENAGKALQVHVSRLRKQLAASADPPLVTQPRGYSLQLGSHDLDLHRFEQLRVEAKDEMTNGDPAAAAEKLHEALSLWRGRPLADLGHERLTHGEIARLAELQLATLEERIDADLALGRHSELIGELEALVAENPLQERLRAQLMVALYRARRQADALEVYHAARRVLIEDLGIEPSPELQELERRILRQDPALEHAEPPSRPKADAATTPQRRAAGTFVAREWELATLEAGLEDAHAGRGRLFLLAGGEGIGKSRLADEFASRAKERCAHVLWGRSWAAGGAPPYWPWVQALRSYVRSRDRDVVREDLDGAASLRELLPELSVLRPDAPAPESVDSEAGRFRLFDSVATFLRNAARRQTIVLVLDDLHAADEPSLLLLQFLAAELAEIRAVVVGAYREADAVAEVLRRLPARHIRLGSFSESAVEAFIERSTGVAPSQSLVAAVHAETEGNPLAVGEVVRVLASEGRLTAPQTPS